MNAVEDRRDLASEARHGGRFLTTALSTGLGLPHMWAGQWFSAAEVREALAGQRDDLTVLAAWMCIDRPIAPVTTQRWSEHIAQMRAVGFDRSRQELLDEALTWPVIRFALGLA